MRAAGQWERVRQGLFVWAWTSLTPEFWKQVAVKAPCIDGGPRGHCQWVTALGQEPRPPDSQDQASSLTCCCINHL